MNRSIETDRLYIRELLPEDEEGMYIMDSDPEVHRYLGQQPVKTRAETGAVIKMIRQQYIDNGVGRWAVIEKETGDFIGWMGFKLMKEPVNGHVNHYDFGYRLARAAWGKGFATEAGKAALDHGLRVRGFSPVFAMTDVHNAASRRVLEKLGFRFVKVFEFDGKLSWGTPDDLMVTWYELGDGL